MKQATLARLTKAVNDLEEIRDAVREEADNCGEDDESYEQLDFEANQLDAALQEIDEVDGIDATY